MSVLRPHVSDVDTVELTVYPSVVLLNKSDTPSRASTLLARFDISLVRYFFASSHPLHSHRIFVTRGNYEQQALGIVSSRSIDQRDILRQLEPDKTN
jgi:hypothetical protein